MRKFGHAAGRIAGLAIFLSLFAGHAAPQPPAATSSEAQVAEVKAQLKYAVEWAARYDAIIEEAVQAWFQALEKVNEAIDVGASEKPMTRAQAQTWTKEWADPLQAKLAKAQTDLAKLPPLSRDKVSAVPRKQLDAINESAAQTTKLVAELDRLVGAVAKRAPAAATGEPHALRDLIAEVFQGVKLTLNASNTQTRSSLDANPPGHPQRALIQAIIANNDAMSDGLDGVYGMLMDKPPSPGLKRSVAGHIADARTAARRIPTDNKLLIDEMKDVATTPAEKALIDRLLVAFSSFEESAKIELEIAEFSEGLLKSLDDPETLDAALETFDRFNTLTDTRAQLILKRATLIGGL